MESLTLRVPHSLRKAAKKKAKLSGRTLCEELRQALQLRYKGLGVIALVYLASQFLNWLSDAWFIWDGCD